MKHSESLSIQVKGCAYFDKDYKANLKTLSVLNIEKYKKKIRYYNIRFYKSLKVKYNR